MAPTVRTLDQILSEIGGVYTPQIQSLQTQQADIPNQVRAEEEGLAAKQKNAFGDILSSARRRGTGVAFGGIPLAEQAQYTASTYMPALANLRTAAKQQATSLQDAINQIQERRQNSAIGLQQYDQQRYDTWKTNQDALAESRRQSEASAASQQADLSQYFAALNTPMAEPEVSPVEQAIYKRAKSLQSLYSSNPGTFNSTVKSLLKKGDDYSKQTILNAYKLLGMSNSPSLKKWGLV